MRTERRRTDEQQTNDQPRGIEFNAPKTYATTYNWFAWAAHGVHQQRQSGRQQLRILYNIVFSRFFALFVISFVDFFLIRVFHIYTWMNLTHANFRRCFIPLTLVCDTLSTFHWELFAVQPRFAEYFMCIPRLMTQPDWIRRQKMVRRFRFENWNSQFLSNSNWIYLWTVF